MIKGADDQLGVVTVHDGPSLREGEIIAPVVGQDQQDRDTFHNNFQDPERFLAAKGLDHRVYLNQGNVGQPFIGHTDAVLWDLERPSPALLTQGTWVQFRAV